MTNLNCRVCRSKLRKKIEDLIFQGQGFRDVAKQYLGNFDCDLHLLEQSIATHQKKHIDQIHTNHQNELSEEEIDLLLRFKEGKVTLDEASRIVATKVFEKILKNPEDVKFIDFFRAELLKIKQQEVTDRNSWAMELVNRMFAGELPPRNCTKCGHPFIELSPQNQIEPAIA